MKRLKSVTIRRFKKLQELTLTLGDVSLLIGANNSGKSSVLQALHFAVSLAQSSRLVGEDLVWQKDAFQISFNPSQLLYSPVADVISLATGGQLQEAAASRVEVELTSTDGDTCRISLRRGRNRNIGVTIEGKALGEILMDIEHPFTVYAPGLAGIAKDERLFSPGVVRRIVARGDANLVLRNVLRMLHSNTDAWQLFLEDMRSLFPKFDVEMYFREQTDEFIEVYCRLDGGPELPIDATGTSVLQASQILAYIGLFKPQLLILDEPDSHLHPNNQRTLCDLIVKLAADRGFQALISTHSRHVLDAMKGHGTVAWLSKGATIQEKDLNATEVLLDLGALDSADYFVDGSLKCVVATEDTEQNPLVALLWSNGFSEDETEVRSYAGCSKLESAVVLSKFLKDKASAITLVVHRDRDYMTNERAADFATTLGKASAHAFITLSNDIESYFLNAKHLSAVNPGLSEAKADELLSEATVQTRDKSIAAIVNLRTAAQFQELRGTGKTPNHGEIALQAIKDYDANPAQLRRGDLVIGPLKDKLHTELKAMPKVFVPSPHLISPELRAIADKLWPKLPAAK